MWEAPELQRLVTWFGSILMLFAVFQTYGKGLSLMALILQYPKKMAVRQSAVIVNDGPVIRRKRKFAIVLSPVWPKGHFVPGTLHAQGGNHVA